MIIELKDGVFFENVFPYKRKEIRLLEKKNTWESVQGRRT